ncbi:hypothetical protein NUSPORA_00626 [Nucleospora cyclopteri]
MSDFTSHNDDELNSIKEYFNNVKFAYRERQSKMYFYQSMDADEIYVGQKVIEQAKENLQAVKNNFEEKNLKIKQLAEETVELEGKATEKKNEVEQLKLSIKTLKEENVKMRFIGENLSNKKGLKEQLEGVNLQIKNTQLEVRNLNSFLEEDRINSYKAEEKSLMEQKKELGKNVKRLTIMNTENDIEEIFFWYNSVVDFYRGLFGEVKYKIDEGILEITVVGKKREIKLILIDKKLRDIQIVNLEEERMEEERMKEFLKYKEWCIGMNDGRAIISRFINS